MGTALGALGVHDPEGNAQRHPRQKDPPDDPPRECSYVVYFLLSSIKIYFVSELYMEIICQNHTCA